MKETFFFYDLETSGINPREDRIMQFAGQRTDVDLNPIGEPVNVLIKMTNEVLPQPDAILITGITPQQTIVDGLTEAEFLQMFYAEIAQPGTIFVGYNTVRFDDEFMRYLHYRNFYDPYEWQYSDGKSRWDLLDVVRMTRALRPEGIEWPFDSNGKASNRLELLTSVNNLLHDNAHDALSDVHATIAIARLIRGKQPKLFDYLLTMRDKKAIATLVTSGEPFVYSSGKYPAQYEKTTVVQMLSAHPTRQGALVYDLRVDPTPFLAMDTAALVEAWRYRRDSDEPRLPIKTLQFNRCPAVAPLGVLRAGDTKKRLGIDDRLIEKNRKLLQGSKDFTVKVLEALERMDVQQQASFTVDAKDVDARLYDGFINDADKQKLRSVRAADKSNIAAVDISFADDRYNLLLPLYKARNYATALTDDDRQVWESFRHQRLTAGAGNSRLAKYFSRLAELSGSKSLTDSQRYCLEELQLWGESIMPEAIL